VGRLLDLLDEIEDLPQQVLHTAPVPACNQVRHRENPDRRRQEDGALLQDVQLVQIGEVAPVDLPLLERPPVHEKTDDEQEEDE
jgi:hypothetical protein